MDLHRLRPPDYVAGLFGLALLLVLFAPWYETRGGTVDGWRSFGVVDVWLALTALLAMSIPVITATRDAPAMPVAIDVLTIWASIVAAVLVIVRLVSVPNAEVVTGRHWGVFAGAACVAGTFAGAVWALRKQDAPGLRPPPPVRLMPPPAERDPSTPPKPC